MKRRFVFGLFAIVAVLCGTMALNARIPKSRGVIRPAKKEITSTTTTTNADNASTQQASNSTPASPVSRPTNFTPQGRGKGSQNGSRRVDTPTPGGGSGITSVDLTDGSFKYVSAGGVSFKMIAVNGGKFKMGRAKSGSDAGYDATIHEVSLHSFYIGEMEVTQVLWKAVMGAYPQCKPHVDNKPAVNVSWVQCQEFVRKLSSMTGKNFRLPTEAEWEFAARGGNKSAGYTYSGGNALNAVAWNIDNSGGNMQTVATTKCNELGIYDMSGNVAEWCSDYYGRNYYNESGSLNPKGPQSGSDRVVRGGAFIDYGVDCNVATRASANPTYGAGTIGLRVVMEP